MEDKFDIKMVYDAICYDAMRQISICSQGAKRIAFKNFDYDNGDHKFILSITMACWGILGNREVAIDDNIFVRAKLSKRYKKLCKIRKTNKSDEKIIDTEKLVDKIYKYVKNAGADFKLEDIYNEYYKER